MRDIFCSQNGVLKKLKDKDVIGIQLLRDMLRKHDIINKSTLMILDHFVFYILARCKQRTFELISLVAELFTQMNYHSANRYYSHFSSFGLFYIH